MAGALSAIQAYTDLFPQFSHPDQGAPRCMIAPYWDDLKTPGRARRMAKSDTAQHRYIVQWKAFCGASSTPLDFESFLYDSIARPSADGSGGILSCTMCGDESV